MSYRRPSRDPPPAPQIRATSSNHIRRNTVESIGSKKSKHEPSVPGGNSQSLEKTPTKVSSFNTTSMLNSPQTPLPAPPPIIYQIGEQGDGDLEIPPPPPLENSKSLESDSNSSQECFTSSTFRTHMPKGQEIPVSTDDLASKVLATMIQDAQSLLASVVGGKQDQRPRNDCRVIELSEATKLGTDLIHLCQNASNVIKRKNAEIAMLKDDIVDVTDSMARWRAREQIQRDKVAKEISLREKMERDMFALRLELDALNRGLARSHLESSLSFPFSSQADGAGSVHGELVPNGRNTTTRSTRSESFNSQENSIMMRDELNSSRPSSASDRMARILNVASQGDQQLHHVHVSRSGSITVNSTSSNKYGTNTL